MRETRKRTWKVAGPVAPAFARLHYGRSPDEIVDRVEGDRIARLAHLGDAPFLLRAGLAESGRASLEVSAERVTEAVLAAARALTRRTFNLEADLPAFYARAEGDRRLGAVVARWRGHRPPLAASFWEAAVWAIFNQQVSVPMAYRTKRRFVERLGRTAEHGGARYHDFPSPERVAEAGEKAVRAVGLTRVKARAIAELAALLAEDPGRFDALARAPEEAAIRELTALYGFGAWTAECALMMGAGHPDVFPALDLGLRDAATRLWGRRERMGEAELRGIAERWRPYRSLAAGYLWHAHRFRNEGGGAPRRLSSGRRPG